MGNFYSAGHTAEDHIRTDISWFNWLCVTGGFLLLWNFSVAISMSPHVCFILVLIIISMFLKKMHLRARKLPSKPNN